MEDLKALGEELLSGKNGAALRALADSAEAQRLSARLDAADAEAAMRSGDPARMKALLESVLSTAEGRSLAQALSKLDGGK